MWDCTVITDAEVHGSFKDFESCESFEAARK